MVIVATDRQRPTTPEEDAAELAASIHDRQRQKIAGQVKEIDYLRTAITLLTNQLAGARCTAADLALIHTHALGLTCEFPGCTQRVTITTNTPTGPDGFGEPHALGLVGAAAAMRWRIGPETAAALTALGERVWSTGIADLCQSHGSASPSAIGRKPT